MDLENSLETFLLGFLGFGGHINGNVGISCGHFCFPGRDIKIKKTCRVKEMGWIVANTGDTGILLFFAFYPTGVDVLVGIQCLRCGASAVTPSPSLRTGHIFFASR